MVGPRTSGFWRWMVLVVIATTASVTGQGDQNGLFVVAQSSAEEDPGFNVTSSYILVNNQKTVIGQNSSPFGRGHQVFILNEHNGQVLNKMVFDTDPSGGGTEAAQQLLDFLEIVQKGRIIVVVVHGNGNTLVNLSPYGSTITTTALGFRVSYAMITQKGPKPSWFVEKRSAAGTGPTRIDASIPTAILNTVAQSSAEEDPGFNVTSSYILVNNQKTVIGQNSSPFGRGHQVFILNEQNGQVLDKMVFDTDPEGGGTEAAQRLLDFLEIVQKGRIIIVVVHDNGNTLVNLSPYGSTITTTALGFRQSYAMITQKGPKPSWFVEKRSAAGTGPTRIDASIPTVPTTSAAAVGTSVGVARIMALMFVAAVLVWY
ncbi:uncharacterized protein LOC144903794 [Branchiostoma floridae x Branchiostoma belcheri]